MQSLNCHINSFTNWTHPPCGNASLLVLNIELKQKLQHKWNHKIKPEKSQFSTNLSFFHVTIQEFVMVCLITPNTQWKCTVTDTYFPAGKTKPSAFILSFCAVTQCVFNLWILISSFSQPILPLITVSILLITKKANLLHLIVKLVFPWWTWDLCLPQILKDHWLPPAKGWGKATTILLIKYWGRKKNRFTRCVGTPH